MGSTGPRLRPAARPRHLEQQHSGPRLTKAGQPASRLLPQRVHRCASQETGGSGVVGGPSVADNTCGGFGATHMTSTHWADSADGDDVWRRMMGSIELTRGSRCSEGSVPAAEGARR